MKCTRCNNDLDPGAKFCSQCGAVVGASYKPQGPNDAFRLDTDFRLEGDFLPKSPVPAVPPPVQVHASAYTKPLVERARAILLSPRTEWPVIAGEPSASSQIYWGYAAPLAAIGALALFVGQVAIGVPVPLIGVVHATVFEGLFAGFLVFVLALVSVGLLTLFVNALAPRFGGQPDPKAALKLTVYGYTPLWLAEILNATPAFAALSVLAGAYCLYLVFIGLPVLMRCTKVQAAPYAMAVVGGAVVLFMVFGVLITALMGFGPGTFA